MKPDDVQPPFGEGCHDGLVPRPLVPLAFATFVVLVGGCATSIRDRAWLDGELGRRVGATSRGDSTDELPSGVALADGLDEGEVVAIALWRDPSLRAELTRIDAAFATLSEARRPANPQIGAMGRLGPISAVATLFVPLESLWQAPRRARSAARDADVVGESVLMRALDLVRDARLLHVELGLAVDRAALRDELAVVARELARIGGVRAGVGDINPMEERILAGDARIADDATDVARTEADLARSRLAARLALTESPDAPLTASFAPALQTIPALVELVALARESRPDARAAELAIAAAEARVGWERSRSVSFGASAEAHWAQSGGPATRLGGRAEVPLFGANPGGIGRANAEVERAAALHEVAARAIALEVRSAHARFEQATRSRERFEITVLPSLGEALVVATDAFESGDESYLIVLDVLRRSGEARLRLAELVAEQRRALCELERAIGARLTNLPRPVGADVGGAP